MPDLDMRARRFYLSRGLSLREYNQLKALVAANPAAALSHSDNYRTVSVKMGHQTDWAAGIPNLFDQITGLLDKFRDLTYEPSLVAARAA
jgi:hypothetical protein